MDYLDENSITSIILDSMKDNISIEEACRKIGIPFDVLQKSIEQINNEQVAARKEYEDVSLRLSKIENTLIKLINTKIKKV